MKNFIGLHILRAGIAISATNLGTSDRLFKKHGRWKSEAVKDWYIHESIETKQTNSYKNHRSLEVPALKYTLGRLHYK